MEIPSLFPQLEVEHSTLVGSRLEIHARASQMWRTCPDCGIKSCKVHSFYLRSPRDLPLSEHPVRLRLRVRRFFCFNSACPRVQGLASASEWRYIALDTFKAQGLSLPEGPAQLAEFDGHTF